MEDIATSSLFIVLGVLILLSAYFSSSETGMMSINRYRLKHLENEGHKGALRVQKLLQRPDRLIGLILIGNNLVNIAASSIATIICMRLFGHLGLGVATAITTLSLTLVILIFAEVTPKTLAALYPERISFPSSIILLPLLTLLYPLVYLVNGICNSLLALFRVKHTGEDGNSLSREELRTVVYEAGTRISGRYRQMLVSILDLEKVSVDDVMVPHNEIVGIDLDDDIAEIAELIRNSEHTRLPVYRDTIDQVVGILHLRKLANLFSENTIEKKTIESLLVEPYFVPEGTPLSTQLVQFQKGRQRFALVVDEYGDIQGIVTLEDILEEIVGEFTTDPADDENEIVRESESTFLVDGAANIREMNRAMNCSLPTDGPKTLNGLVLEYLETIPDSGTGLKIDGYPIEIIETKENKVQLARIYVNEDRRRSVAD